MLSGENHPSCLFLVRALDWYGQDALWEELIINNKYISLPTFNKNQSSDELSIIFEERKGFHCAVSIIDNKKKPFAKTISFKFGGDIYKNISFIINYTSDISVHLRNCSIGEYFDISQENCFPCSVGYYSFSDNFSTVSSCQKCIDNKYVCYGGKNIIPRTGYWRIDERSPNFLKCPNKLACLGDEEDSSYMVSINIDNRKSLIGKCAMCDRI